MADKPLTLQGSDYAPAVQGLNKAIDRAEGLSLRRLDRSPDYQRSYSFPMLKMVLDYLKKLQLNGIGR
jgi:hypothetical protein